MAGNLIRQYRERENLSQEAMARLLKCSTGMVSHIENDRRPITPKKAVRWEPILGIPREQLCPDIFEREAA